MLNEVADGAWVRQSGWVWSNAVVVRDESGLTLVDPGIDGADLDQLADDGLLTPLPADGGPVPGEILQHQAHAPGHAAVLLADRGVLLAGDMRLRRGQEPVDARLDQDWLAGPHRSNQAAVGLAE